MKKKYAQAWCPECEKLEKKVKLVGGCCPECHYMYLIRRT